MTRIRTDMFISSVTPKNNTLHEINLFKPIFLPTYVIKGDTKIEISNPISRDDVKHHKTDKGNTFMSNNITATAEIENISEEKVILSFLQDKRVKEILENKLK